MSNKNEILEIMSGDSFEDYLKSIDLFRDSLDDGTLNQKNLDQEIIERACAVMAIERWAQQSDYVAMLDKMIDTIPQYEDLLQRKETQDHLSGVVIFINGLGQSTYDISGFGYGGHGFLLAQSSLDQIVEYLKKSNREKDAEIFDEFHKWFERIYTAQVVLGYALMEITKWNESMATGFYNILTVSQISYQDRLLSCLYKAIEDPVVKKNIFGAYLSVLNDIFNDASKVDIREDIQEIIDMVNQKAEGKD